MEKLKSHPSFGGPRGPVVLAIMDGVGIGTHPEADMVARASTPHLDWMKANCPFVTLKAHGTAVGQPSDEDMGNSEVGHNAIGAGRVFAQGARLVLEAIESGRLFAGEVWQDLVLSCREEGGTLHFIGLLSDGNVHSHLDHLLAMLRRASAEGVARARVHVLLDGRDVSPTSALEYVDRLEAVLTEIGQAPGRDYRIASGGGRMVVTMDRYEADWAMVERGWNLQVRGEGPQFPSARAAIEAARAARPGVIDQDLPGFVVADQGTPVGPMVDGDVVVLFNFRGDRAMETCRAFEQDDFQKFDRGTRPQVKFAGMMQYDGDLKIPGRYLVSPPALSRTLGEYLARAGLRQLAISETQKYGHVTYFFNGNRSGKFAPDLEDYVEIPSDRLSFDQRPWMKAAEITDAVLQALESGIYRFIRINYPNGDMVGHTGDLLATEISVEATDLSIGRLMKGVKAAGGILIATADHGNADEMLELDKKTGQPLRDKATGALRPKTAHSLNPVPCYIYDPLDQAKVRLTGVPDPGISSLAATVIRLLGYLPPDDYDPAVAEPGV